MVEAQGGDSDVIKDTSKFETASIVKDVISPYDGYITFMDTKECGIASCILGAGRETKEDSIDYSAGIILKKKRYVEKKSRRKTTKKVSLINIK